MYLITELVFATFRLDQYKAPADIKIEIIRAKKMALSDVK